MRNDQLDLELLGADRADLYLSGADESADTWRLVRALDEDGVRVVAPLPDARADSRRIRRIMGACSGAAALMPFRDGEQSTTEPALLHDLRHAAKLRLPVALLAEPGVRVEMERAVLRVGSADPISFPDPAWVHIFTDDAGAVVAWLRERIPTGREPTAPYAYLVGRLERDFAHARDAVRAAVEGEAGIPCLWADDGQHRTNVAGVRERTRLLIRNASFVVADLTLGRESPDRENPSRAHEIGMAIAYDREIMLCSQEPRRYPYFSIGDMQMTFWTTEAELEASVANWIRTTPGAFRRRVLNHELQRWDKTYQPRIAGPSFSFDPGERFVGPKARRPLRHGALALGLGLVIGVVAALVVLA